MFPFKTTAKRGIPFKTTTKRNMVADKDDEEIRVQAFIQRHGSLFPYRGCRRVTKKRIITKYLLFRERQLNGKIGRVFVQTVDCWRSRKQRGIMWDHINCLIYGRKVRVVPVLHEEIIDYTMDNADGYSVGWNDTLFKILYDMLRNSYSNDRLDSEKREWVYKIVLQGFVKYQLEIMVALEAEVEFKIPARSTENLIQDGPMLAGQTMKVNKRKLITWRWLQFCANVTIEIRPPLSWGEILERTEFFLECEFQSKNQYRLDGFDQTGNLPVESLISKMQLDNINRGITLHVNDIADLPDAVYSVAT